MTAASVRQVPAAAPGRWHDDERRAVTDAVARVVDSGRFVGGPEVDAFEARFAAYVGVAHCVGVDNGSNALTIALHALDLPRDGVVLVPANDGGFAASAVQAAGMVPAVVDVDATTGLVTAETLEAAVTLRVVAAVVTHLHGLLADMPAILRWSRAHGVALVEDCAQAHGAHRDGIRAGASGDAATFSFYPTKNLGALGDAGAVVTGRAEVADRARLLRQYGWSPRFRVEDGRGRNSRLDAVQAAVLSARLPFLDAANDARRAVLRRYRSAAPGLGALGPVDGSHVVHHAVVRTPRRDELQALLHERGIGADVHYPYLVQEMRGIALASPAPTPQADALRRECLTLPCFPGMSEDELGTVCDVLGGWAAR